MTQENTPQIKNAKKSVLLEEIAFSGGPEHYLENVQKLVNDYHKYIDAIPMYSLARIQGEYAPLKSIAERYGRGKELDTCLESLGVDIRILAPRKKSAEKQTESEFNEF